LRCPPEDIGGVPGFYEFLDAINDPKHPDHEDRIDWYGEMFDPDELDTDRIRKTLNRIATRRKRAVEKRPT
jgi:Plasmid pRiA4b ORF-3-like protein